MQALRNPKKNPNFLKAMKRRTRSFSYKLLVNNGISTLVYCLLYALNSIYLLLLPLGVLIDIERINSSRARAQLNYVYHLVRMPGFMLTTDVINALLLILLLVNMVALFKVDYRATLKRQAWRQAYKALSFMCIVTGKFIVFFFISVQIAAIKSFFMDMDSLEVAGMPRLITNLIGITLSVGFSWFAKNVLTCVVPEDTIPWAQPQNSLYLIKLFQNLFVAFALAFQSNLMSGFTTFIILIPMLVLQTAQVLAVTFKKAAFSRKVDFAVLVQDTIVWSFIFFAFIIELLDVNSAVSFITLTAIASGILPLSLFLIKQKAFEVQIFQKAVQNDQQAENILHTILHYSQQEDQKNDLKLRQLYLKHKFNCRDPCCACGASCLSSLGSSQQPSQTTNCSQLIHFSQTEEAKSFNTKVKFIQEVKNQKRNYQLLQLTINQFKKRFDQSKRLVFFEVFMKTKFLDDVFVSLYNLQLIKNKCRGRRDQLTYYYLKMQIFHKTNEIQRASNIEIFDVNSIIEVDNLLREYKHMINETSLLVKQFWINLAKQEMQITQQMELGNNIVENYIQIKDTYESIITLKPEHNELIQISLHFNQDVMNFELEAMQLQNLLKKVQQKITITRQNQYDVTREQQGIVIISSNLQNKNKIIYANRNICELLEYSSLDVVNKDVAILMPAMIGQIHDTFIERYLKIDHQRRLSSNLRRLWAKKADGSIVAAKANLQTCISETLGLVIVAFILPVDSLVTQNINCKAEDAYFLLADDTGQIINYSSNFLSKYMPGHNAANEDSNNNINEVFCNLEEFTPEELEAGVRTHLIPNYFNNYYGCMNADLQNKSIQVPKLEIALSIQTYRFSAQVQIQEVIFVEHESFGSTLSGENMHLNVVAQVGPQLLEESFHDNFLDYEDPLDKVNQDRAREMQSMSSASGSSGSTALLMSKGTIDFKQVPQSLQNLKKAILMFFVTLIATSFSVLGVTMNSFNQFKNDANAVTSSIYMTRQMSSLRLGFRSLLTLSKDYSDEFSGQLELLGDQLSDISQKLRQNQNYLKSVQKDQRDRLKRLVEEENLILYEMQSNGNINKYSTSFAIGLYQYLTRLQQIMAMSQADFLKEFKNIRIRDVDGSSSQLAKDAYFLVQNGLICLGNGNLRDLVNQLAQQYVIDAEEKEGIYILTVITISVCCIAITIIASCIIIPVTFALDSEEADIVKKWMLVSDEAKHVVLKNINEFVSFLQNDKLLEKRPQQRNVLSADDVFSDNQSLYNKSMIAFITPNTQTNLDQNQFSYDNENVSSCQIIQPEVDQLLDKAISMPQNDHSQQEAPEEYKEDPDRSISYLVKKPNARESYKDGPANHTKPNLTFINSRGSLDSSVPNIFTTTNNQLTNNNMQTTSGDFLSQAQLRISQRDQLKSIFRKQKAKKITVIMSFSLVIIAFYLATYFTTQNIFTSSSQSYIYLNTINSRGPCLLDSFLVLTEALAENNTIYFDGQKKLGLDYINSDCLNLERTYEGYLTKVPPQLSRMHQLMLDLNSDKLCSIVFIDNQSMKERCNAHLDGQMRKGLKSSVNSIYYFLLSNLVEFDSVPPSQRTQKFLDSKELSNLPKRYTVMIFQYLLPTFDYLSDEMGLVLREYLTSQISKFLAVFAIFLVFLVGSLLVTMKIIIRQLQKVVYRTKILLKIIPVEELQKISKQEMLRKSRE